MKPNMDTAALPLKDDEDMDLLDLMRQLWRGKMAILVFMLVSLISAGAYLFFAKEKWTSIAIVTLPDTGQFVNYANALSVIPQMPSNIQQNLFERFRIGMEAASLTVKGESKTGEVLKISPFIKGLEPPLEFRYTSETAKGAQDQLNTWITRAQASILKELYDDLKHSVNAKKIALKQSLAVEEAVANEKKDRHLRFLNYARTVALQADIKAPLFPKMGSIDESTLFLLGSRTLDVMVENDKQNPPLLRNDYYNMRQDLLKLNGLKFDTLDLSTFRYVMPPTLPVKRDSPKLPLTLIVALLLGGILGSIYVLCRNGFRRRA